MNENQDMKEETKEEEKKEKYPILTTEITLFLFSLGLFSTLAINSNLILTRVCLERFRNSSELGDSSVIDFCRNTSNPMVGKDDYVQKHSAQWDSYLSVAYLAPAFFTCLFAGSWGDKFGRKFVLYIPPIGFCIACGILTAVDLHIETMPWWTMIVGAIINGITGGEMIMIAGSISYIVSITDPGHRIRRISILQSLLVGAVTLGPIISLPLRNKWGNYSVYLFAAALSAASFIYTAILKPVYSEDRKSFSLTALIDIRHVKDSLYVVVRPRENSRRMYLALAFLGLGVDFFVNMGARTILYLFVKDAPFSWTYGEYVTLVSSLAGAGGIAMLVVFPLIRTFLEVTDTGFGIFVAIHLVVYLASMGFVTTKTTIYIASSALVIAGFLTIVFRTIISKLVDPNEGGKLFSVAAVMENFVFLMAKLGYNAVWPAVRKIWRGIPYELSAAISLISLFVMIYLYIQFKRDDKKQKPCELTAVNPVDTEA